MMEDGFSVCRWTNMSTGQDPFSRARAGLTWAIGLPQPAHTATDGPGAQPSLAANSTEYPPRDSSTRSRTTRDASKRNTLRCLAGMIDTQDGVRALGTLVDVASACWSQEDHLDAGREIVTLLLDHVKRGNLDAARGIDRIADSLSARYRRVYLEFLASQRNEGR